MSDRRPFGGCGVTLREGAGSRAATLLALFLIWAAPASGQGRLGIGVALGTADRMSAPESDEPGPLHGRLRGVAATWAFGARAGVGLEWSRVPSLDVAPTGFEYRQAPAPDRLDLGTVSLWYAPICGSLCVLLSGGVGRARLRIDMDHLSGDVMERYRTDERVTALRFAISAEYGDRIRPKVTVADHFLPAVRPWWHAPSSGTRMAVHMAAVTLGVAAYLF